MNEVMSPGENDYDKSYVVGELDIFLSHSGSTGHSSTLLHEY